jgi:hypothetical protein
MLNISDLNITILCFTEHWLLQDKLNDQNIDQFRLVSKFCRTYSTSGGSRIFTRNIIQNKEVV